MTLSIINSREISTMSPNIAVSYAKTVYDRPLTKPSTTVRVKLML
jgi:hypothetical protein